MILKGGAVLHHLHWFSYLGVMSLFLAHLSSPASAESPAQTPSATKAAHAPSLTAALPPPPPGVTDLSFSNFFKGSALGLVPTATLQAADGKHVRLVGFMARLEQPLTGAFILCPHPTACDEEGNGTADLPPQSVHILVRGLTGKPVPFTPEALAVTGTLHIAVQTDDDGHVWGLNLTMDRPQDLGITTLAASPSSTKTKTRPVNRPTAHTVPGTRPLSRK